MYEKAHFKIITSEMLIVYPRHGPQPNAQLPSKQQQDLPHFFVLQDLVSKVLPEQGIPPLAALVIVILVRVCCPPPQFLLHGLQGPHTPQRQLTVAMT